jgi:hypothetical protein
LPNADKDIYVVVDPDLNYEDRDRSNNTAHFSIFKPDIEVSQMCWQAMGPVKRAITVSVKNSSGETKGPEWTFTTKEILAGDINYDGSVDLADAILALKIIAGMGPDQTVYELADVNGDGKIGMEEAIYILQKLSGVREQ